MNTHSVISVNLGGLDDDVPDYSNWFKINNWAANRYGEGLVVLPKWFDASKLDHYPWVMCCCIYAPVFVGKIKFQNDWQVLEFMMHWGHLPITIAEQSDYVQSA